MNPRIQAMVESRQLEPDAAEDREVLVRWRKSVRTYADSRKDLAPDSVLTLSYQAGLQAATAILRAAGYRVRSSASGHHRVVFDALRGLGIDGLSPLGREMNDLRRERHHAVYEWDDDEESAAGMDPAKLEEIVGRFDAARPSLARRAAAVHRRGPGSASGRVNGPARAAGRFAWMRARR